MRVSRLYVDQPLQPGDTLTLDAAASQYLTRVLRRRVGDAVQLFNGDGREYLAVLAGARREAASVSVGAVSREEPAAALRSHLWLGVARGERMDYSLQKAVELGVSSLTPLYTERSQVKLNGDRERRRLEHWRGVIVSACEQCGRCRLPELRRPTPLRDHDLQPLGLGLLLDPQADTALPALPAPAGDITLLIGPEGGLTPQEAAAARTAGFHGVRLGPRILRAETAPLAALAAIQVLWGDLR
jgi:16S rRNA (uracil1498-N3)-methyltransferase